MHCQQRQVVTPSGFYRGDGGGGVGCDGGGNGGGGTEGGGGCGGCGGGLVVVVAWWCIMGVGRKEYWGHGCQTPQGAAFANTRATCYTVL